MQGTVFADRGVRSLTALRSLRCLALEVYQNVAMDGLVCLSVITQVTQLQARAHATLDELFICACDKACSCLSAISHAAGGGTAPASAQLHKLDDLLYSNSLPVSARRCSARS